MYAAGGAIAAPEPEADVEVVNWSGTHAVRCARHYAPESTAELEAIVAGAHAAGERVRVVGSALSPNGTGLCADGMVSLALCDKVLAVDEKRKRVTVEAGCRVRELVEALRPYGLTLENYASIAEQQVGGFVSVGAHGTGAAVPPVDEQVVSLKLVTPARGTLELSAEGADAGLFRLARVAMGTLGAISEVTLQLVDAHKLHEVTYVATRDRVRREHEATLKRFKHVRYMWLPYTDDVVVVGSNPVKKGAELPDCKVPAAPEVERVAEMRALLRSAAPEVDARTAADASFAELRDALLAVDCADSEWVAKVNRAEAAFWRKSEGERCDWSDKVLGFECGGQQWVSEVAFPCGTYDKPDMADMDFMEELLDAVEHAGIAAPSPLEQRWTSGSSSPMSPAAGAADSLHCWVGIIMYLPTEEPLERERITARFKRYCELERRVVLEKFGAHHHWAKIEPAGPLGSAALEHQRARLRKRFGGGTAALAAARRQLDPKGVMSNDLIEAVLPASEGA